MPPTIEKKSRQSDETVAIQDTEQPKIIDRFQALPTPSQPTTIEAWRETIRLCFPECLSGGEIGLAVVAQLLIRDVRNPFGLVFVDVPSAGKTITLNFFSELEDLVYSTDNFTPSSLVSHATNRNRKDLDKIDLLPRIRFKTVVVRDLAPIFAERQENLLKNLGVLTRVFDGEGYESDSGVHGKRGYKGDYTFMFLAGSTPIAPRVWRFMGSLGSRLFFFPINAKDKSEDELADLLIQDDFKEKERACREATRNIVLTIWGRFVGGVTWNKGDDPMELRQIIARCAKLLAHTRGTLSSWGEEAENGKAHMNPIIEKPMRINQLLYNLARGHALAAGRTVLQKEDMWPVIDATVNSAQASRVKLLAALMDNNGKVSTGYIEKMFGCSNPTALKEIEAFRLLGLADIRTTEPETGRPGRPEKILAIKDDFAWFCSQDCANLRQMRP